MRIGFTGVALRQFAALGAVERKRIRQKLDQYADDPKSLANQVKALHGSPGLRLRVGDYRVVFVIRDDEIVVTKIGHRRDVYR